MIRIKKLMTDRKGSAMSFVVLALLVLFIMVGIVASIAQTNIRQASSQEKGLQAYYIARSGAELAYQVLLTTTPSFLEEFKANKSKVLTENNVDFEEGTADIKVTSTGDGAAQKIHIESVGRLKNADVSRKVNLEFYVDYATSPSITWSD